MRSFEAFYCGAFQPSGRARIPGFCRRSFAHVVALLVTLAASPALATDLPVDGGPGGSYFRLDCSRDYVVGVYVRSGSWVDAVGLKCASFDAARGTFKLPAWNTPYHGGSGGAPAQVLCPGNTYHVSGIQVGFTREGNDPKFIDYIELTCSPVGPGAEVRVCLETGEGCWQHHPNQPGFNTSFLPSADRYLCPAGEAGVGIHGRAGRFVDALGLVCGPKPVMATATPTPPAATGKTLGKRKLLVATVIADVDVYDAPDGIGNVIGVLRAGMKVRLLAPCRDGWCNVQANVPGGGGWVWGDCLRL